MLVISAAFATGIITLIVAITKLIISKEDRISEYRHEQMDKLRENISDLLGSATTICKLVENEDKVKIDGITGPNMKAFRTLHKDLYDKLNKAWHGALISLYPEDLDSSKLMGSINVLSAEFYGSCTNLQSIEGKIADVQTHTRVVNHKAWTKVKKGETIFHLFKWGCIVLAGISVVALGFLARPIITYAKSLDLDSAIRKQLLEIETEKKTVK